MAVESVAGRTEVKYGEALRVVREAKGRTQKCTLLIGAGCSKTGGIPLARQFVEIVKNNYPDEYTRAEEKDSYPDCMAQLTTLQRLDLIAKYVDKATVNRAHLGIAQLIKHGYVDRVLTTNFDPLVQRACAMVGEIPAVYDCTAIEFSDRTRFYKKSVFYLHGQRTGLTLQKIGRAHV